MAINTASNDSKNVLISMLLLHLGRRMAFITSVLNIGCRVAGETADLPLPTMVKREGMRPQNRWRPGCGCMTGFTSQAKHTGMYLGLRVTGAALGGGAAE